MGKAVDVLHHQIRLASGSRAGIEDLGDRRVVHDGQRLPLGFESLHGCSIVHSGPDQLQRDLAPDRFDLLGQPDLSHAADAEFLQQTVRPDDLRLGFDFWGLDSPRSLRQSVGVVVGGEQRFDFLAQFAVLRTRLVEIGSTFGGRPLQR